MPHSDKYWQREEILSKEELREIQLKRLRWVVRHAYHNVPFYRRAFKDVGVHPDDIKKLEDVSKLPFTTKEHLRDNYPFGLFAVPIKDIIRIHTSSGTTGRPKVVGYTAKDLENWINMCARCLYMAGIRRNDVFQNMVNYTLFTGGLGFHYAAERIGAMVIPSGTGNTRKQIQLMLDLGTTAIHSTPSYALHIKEVAEDMGKDPSEIGLRIGCFGAEPWSESLRKKIEESFGLEAFDSYGLSEMNGPGVAFECEEHDGLHIWIDHYLVEIVDPKTGEVLSEGEKGELVLTPLTKEALPLIRYRTGDITFLMDDECSCGRTHPKIHRIVGRTDDMMIVRGVNVFPNQIEQILMNVPEVGDNYQIVLTKRGALDEMIVRVEIKDEFFTGELSDLERIKRKIESHLREEIGIRVGVELVEKGTLERFEGKAKRIIDLRNPKTYIS